MHVRDAITNSTFSIREISEAAAQQDDVVRFDIGQPDLDAPPAVKKGVGAVARSEQASYTSLWGRAELREQIAAVASRKVDLTAANVMVSTGGIGALFCVIDAVLDAGETVLANDPAWSPYRLITAATPGTLKQVPYFDGNTVDGERVRAAITNDTQALIVNTPTNPTGRVYTPDQLETLGQIAAEHGLTIIADEVYDRLLYGGAEHTSIASMHPDRTVLINSMSKNYAMTGYRIGWAAAQDEQFIHELGKVNRATTACPNYLSQRAAEIALAEAPDYPAEMRAIYEQRRDRVMAHITDLGWDCVPPHGAIYAFPDTGRDSWDFARELLDEAGVAVVPGEPCGSASDTNIRICFGSADMDAIDDGFERIKAFV